MQTLPTIGSLLRDARRDAGVTQAQLAARMGTSQSSVAALERPGANPTLATIRDAFDALGLELQITPQARARGVDETLVRRHLERSPAERLAVLDRMTADVAALRSAPRV